jgi:hypothetical protein
MVVASSASDERAHLTKCLLDNAATRGENAALRQALQVNVAAVSSLFARLLEAENEHPWLVDALRRSEERCVELEAQLVNLGNQLDAIYQTKTVRLAAPVRRIWGVILRVTGSVRGR